MSSMFPDFHGNFFSFINRQLSVNREHPSLSKGSTIDIINQFEPDGKLSRADTSLYSSISKTLLGRAIEEWWPNTNRKTVQIHSGSKDNREMTLHWFENGTLESEEYFTDQRPCRIHRAFHPNGVLASYVDYSKDPTDSCYYYDNGQQMKIRKIEIL